MLKALLLLAPNLRVVLVDKVSLVNQRIYLFIYMLFPKFKLFICCHKKYHNHVSCHHQIAKGRTQKLYWTEPPNDPNSLLSHLTTFYFRGYKGLKHEVDFVKFILKEARVLKAMRIEVHHHSKLKKSVFEELSIFPRRSSTCLLSVK